MALEQLFKKYQAREDQMLAEEGFFFNFLGVGTSIAHFPQGDELSGKVFSVPPTIEIGDGVFSSALEYEALLTAIDESIGQETLTVCEFGAGWGPWVSAAGVVGKRAGFPTVKLVAVEADAHKHKVLQEQLGYNGLTPETGVISTTHNAAIWHSNGVLHFPKDVHPKDFGARTTDSEHTADYRGMHYQSIEVPAVSLGDVIADHPCIDYMHVDIQGAEVDVLEPFMELLSKRVKYMFIGTHSRMIEGLLIELFHSWRWRIHAANACGFVHDPAKDTMLAMTVSDGELFVSNPRMTGNKSE